MRIQIGLVALALASACTHATSAQRPGPPPEWPAAPAPARVRWAASFPDENTRRPSGSLWRRVLDFVVGFDADRSAEAPVFERPFGVAIAGDAVLVADPDGAQVVRVAWRKGEFEQLSCPKPWLMPMAVAAGPDGATYVADAAAKLVVRHTPAGCTELGAGALERPTGLAIYGGRLYVIDPPRHAVVAFSLEGRELFRFGERGDGEGQLNFPTAIAARPDGRLLVVDALNFRVVSFTAEGKRLGSFGEPGDGEGAFGRPKAVAVDDRGRIYVTDAQLDVVVVFDEAGKFDFAFGGSGGGPGALTLPAGIAIAESTVFVANAYNHRLEIFSLVGGQP